MKDEILNAAEHGTQETETEESAPSQDWETPQKTNTDDPENMTEDDNELPDWSDWDDDSDAEISDEPETGGAPSADSEDVDDIWIDDSEEEDAEPEPSSSGRKSAEDESADTEETGAMQKLNGEAERKAPAEQEDHAELQAAAGDGSTEPNSPEPDRRLVLLGKLLSDMGYEAETPEESYQRYLAEHEGNRQPVEAVQQEPQVLETELQAKDAENAPTGEPETNTQILRSTGDLDKLKAAYPEQFSQVTSLREIDGIGDVLRRMVQKKVGVVDAWKELHTTAENDRLAAKGSKEHLVPAVGRQAVGDSSVLDTVQLRELKRFFPDKNDNEIRALYKKVMKNSR